MHEQVLYLEDLGAVLRAYAKDESGDFRVGTETTKAMMELAEKMKPNPAPLLIHPQAKHNVLSK
jgi:hypothetical protein